MVVENNRTLPYGEPWLPEVSSANDKKFTTYQRDSESGLDYAMNRYSQSTLGRLTSVDAGPNLVHLPRSLNRYVYVMNDPINRIDPDGNQGTLVVTVVGEMPPPAAFLGAFLGGLGGGGEAGGVSIQDPNHPIHTMERALQRWNGLSDNCRSGLTGAMSGEGISAIGGRVAALNQALAAKDSLIKATADTNIPWAMLAAIGIRESGFNNIKQPNGDGRGIFQIDIGQHPDVAENQAMDPTFAASYAAKLLQTNYGILVSRFFPNMDQAAMLQATAASYNFGTGNITGNPATIDVGTTGNNYGSNVVNLMDCFK
jgi:RHS repeat-associated protein